MLAEQADRLKAIQHPEWPQGKAGRLGVADPSPDNNIDQRFMSRPKDVRISHRSVMRFTECDQIETDDRTAKRLLNRLQKAQKRRNPKNAKGFGLLP